MVGALITLLPFQAKVNVAFFPALLVHALITFENVVLVLLGFDTTVTVLIPDCVPAVEDIVTVISVASVLETEYPILSLGIVITILSSYIRFKNYREILEELREKQNIIIEYIDKYKKQKNNLEYIYQIKEDDINFEEIEKIRNDIAEYDTKIESTNILEYLTTKDIIKFNDYKGDFEFKINEIVLKYKKKLKTLKEEEDIENIKGLKEKEEDIEDKEDVENVENEEINQINQPTTPSYSHSHS
jgi:hypothetical protein